MNHTSYFMSIAQAVALKSKDPSTKVGAVIVDKQNRIISTGYNGFVSGCDESHMTFDKPLKYLTIIHAEQNALIYAHRNLNDHTIYCTHAPCSECLKHILQAGIRTIYYDDSSLMKRASDESNEAVLRLIKATDAHAYSLKTGFLYQDEIAILKKN